MAVYQFNKSLITLILIAGFIPLYFLLPRFLTYSSPPLKSDAIVFLLGQNYASRRKEAQKLIYEGYSKHLVVPFYDKMLKATEKKGFVPMENKSSIKNRPTKQMRAKPEYRLFEDTHLEILHAKVMMDRMGFESANFVSSPYHMRRIKLIADRVFDGEKYNLSFVPTRYEKTNKKFWFLKKFDLNWVLSEYLKIAWFFVYEPL